MKEYTKRLTKEVKEWKAFCSLQRNNYPFLNLLTLDELSILVSLLESGTNPAITLRLLHQLGYQDGFVNSKEWKIQVEVVGYIVYLGLTKLRNELARSHTDNSDLSIRLLNSRIYFTALSRFVPFSKEFV